MRIIQFVSLFIIILGLFDRWGYGSSNPSPIDIALKPEYFGHSNIYAGVVSAFIFIIVVLFPDIILKNMQGNGVF